MDLSILQLEKPTKAVEEFLRQDIARNGLLLYNLTKAYNLCEWYVVYEKNILQGCLVVYKGGRGMDSFMTRGQPKAVQALIHKLSYPLIFTISPQHHIPLIKARYQFLNRGEFTLMHLIQSDYKPPLLQPAEALSPSDLSEVDVFYRDTVAGAWNPVQLSIGPFYCIRENGQIVSICGTIGVYHSKPGVAVIGNLLTLPGYQRRGYGTSVLCHVINDLFKTYQHVTLFVEADNEVAIRIYNRLGFRVHENFVIGVCQSVQ